MIALAAIWFVIFITTFAWFRWSKARNRRIARRNRIARTLHEADQ